MNKRNRKGFTLLEMLMAAAIFAITVVIGVDLFFNIVRLQKRTSYVQDIQNDARSVLEEMVREVKLGNIDYAYYADPNRDSDQSDRISFYDLRDPAALPGAKKILVTRDQDNNQYFFERVVTAEQLKDGSGNFKYVIKFCSIDAVKDLISKCDVPGNWQPITSPDVHVVRFNIIVTPTADPFVLTNSGDYLADYQPKVTIIYDTIMDTKDKGLQLSTNLQTTVSSRIYQR